MASKSLKKRARCDVDDHQPTVDELRAELESAKKSIEQLRREKDYERRQVRDEEQAKAAVAVKELTCRLQAERQQQLSELRETLRLRHEDETTKLARQHELNIRKLREDLDKCQNQLRDEIENRGLSTSVRASFEVDRSRLIQKVTDLGTAKRRLEESLQSAVEADKQKAAEIRRLQEACKLEVGKVSKDANAEIRKLLEELKAKDHQFALLDRNQYPDRGVRLLSDQVKPTAEKDISKINGLKADVDRLTGQLAACESDKLLLTARLERLQLELAQRDETIARLQEAKLNNDIKTDKQEAKQGILCTKSQQKAVRFLLPGFNLPVPARDVPVPCEYEDDISSVDSEVSDLSNLSSATTSSIMSPDTTVLFDENVEKNYRLLLKEHMELQRSISLLLTSWTSSSSSAETKKSAYSQVNMYEEIECALRQQLKEQKEQTEELEFRLFELEETAEMCKPNRLETVNSQTAEDELKLLRTKLEKYQSLESELCHDGAGLHEYIRCLCLERDQLQVELNRCQSNINKLNEKLKACTCSQSTEDHQPQNSFSLDTVLSDSMTTDLDESDWLSKSDAVMTCSISSATSGFDDNSCASSVADMRLDEMPSEETWSFDNDEFNNVLETAASTPRQPADCCFHLPSVGQEDLKPVEDAKLERLTTDQAFVPADEVHQMERLWLSRIENLEKRLQQAVESEQRSRDQLVLQTEEKNRRIAVLEDQVDRLEADEFRLSQTIETLEQMQRTFNCHSLPTSADIKSSPQNHTPSTVASPFNSDVSKTNMECIMKNTKYLGTMLEMARNGEASASTLDLDDIGHPCGSDKCVQCQACCALKKTVKDLHAIEKQHAEFDQKIKQLDSQSVDDTTNGCQAADNVTVLQVVDFEEEFRELEVLVKELKRLLVVSRNDENSVRTPTIDCNASSLISADANTSSLSFQFDEDESVPPSHISEYGCPSMVLLTERNREHEIMERHLQQQIYNIDAERRQLKELVQANELTIRDLDIHAFELQASERALKDELKRLKTKDDWMNRRIDDLMELVSRLEENIKTHQLTESELRLKLERNQTVEADLHRELENVTEELMCRDSKYRRWIAQLEDERVTLLSRVEELTDKNIELESQEAGLICRLRKMEVAEIGQRNEIAQLQRALNRSRGEIVEERLMGEDWVDDELRRDEVDHLKELVLYLQQSVEFNKRSNSTMETQLNEFISMEKVLRDTIAEYERIDQIWQDKVARLEADNNGLTGKMEELEAQLKSYEQRYTVNLSVGTMTENLMTYDGPQMVNKAIQTVQQSIAAAIKGLILLSDIEGDANDTEHSYWAAVECASNDDVTDDELKAADWSDIEAHMGLNAVTDETSCSDQLPSLPAVSMPTASDKEHSSSSSDPANICNDSQTTVSMVKSLQVHRDNVDSSTAPERKLIVVHASKVTPRHIQLQPLTPAQHLNKSDENTQESSHVDRNELSKETDHEMKLDNEKSASAASADDKPTAAELESLKNVKQRSSKARQFWTIRTEATSPTPTSVCPSQIPRSDMVRQLPTATDKSGRASVIMPVIRPSAASKELSKSNQTVLTLNKTFTPRVVTDTTDCSQPTRNETKQQPTKQKVGRSVARDCFQSSGPTNPKSSYLAVSSSSNVRSDCKMEPPTSTAAITVNPEQSVVPGSRD